MARIRSLKPEAPQHRKVGRLSIWARWLWLVMVTQADDDGRLPADAGQLRLLAFGYDEDVTAAKVADWLAEIAQTGLIVRYDVRTVPYAYFPSWKDHQKIDRPRPSKYPPPPELRSTRPRRALADPSSKTRRGSEGSDRKDQGSRIEGSQPGHVSLSDSKNSHDNGTSLAALQGNRVRAEIRAQHPTWSERDVAKAATDELLKIAQGGR